MIWSYLNVVADGIWYCVMAGMFVAIVLAFRVSIDAGRRFMRVVDLVAASGQLLHAVAEIGLGNAPGAAVHLLVAAMWMYWWWRSHDDDWKKRRRKAVKRLGEKGKAALRRMVENLKPVPGRRPVPSPV